jgi:hypothetical protein
MNRSDIVARTIWLKQLATAALDARKNLIAELNADARAEFEEQGTASTWRIKGMATVPQAQTADAVVVVDEDKFLDWVQARHPTEVETVTHVRPAFRALVLGKLVKVAGDVCHIDGEVVPGVEFKPGGEFIGISVTPTAAAKEAFTAVASATLLELVAKSGLEAPREVEGA